MVERELHGVLHVAADDALRPAHRGDEADLDLLLGEGRSGERERHGRHTDGQDTHGLEHFSPPQEI
jgi:hypothetical protein